jgi:predicted RNase H-like nuclease (RuvC/YqgF family)
MTWDLHIKKLEERLDSLASEISSLKFDLDYADERITALETELEQVKARVRGEGLEKSQE